MSESERADFEQRVKTWHTFSRFMIAGAIAVAVMLAGLAVTLT